MQIPGYEIRESIGQGGMATAYLAEQTSLGREVVLKVLDTGVNDSEETVERFLNEGRLVASLNHPYIITIFDIGIAEESVYISMEFVEGGDLKERLKQQVFTPIDAIDLIAKISSGLAAAHDKGIVHRDVKPGNIFFRKDGTPLLSDFGIAKKLEGDNDLTSTGMFLGSPNYMAPEQSDAGGIDGRADIYSLGVIFYEMLTGQKPYYSDSVIDIIFKHKNEAVPTLPEELAVYQPLLNLMMAKDRNDRFRDARALMHYIQALKDQGAVPTIEELAEAPDFDITGSGEFEKIHHVTRVTIKTEKKTWAKPLLGIALMLAVLGYGSLLVIERQMAKPASSQMRTPPLMLESITVGHGSEDLLGKVDPKVQRALAWLGRNSLNEYRLTAPPKENAYYYFMRLLQSDPNNQKAHQGLADIAIRYAFLAEREIASDNYQQAKDYINIGLQVDPNNGTLKSLQALSSRQRTGFWTAVMNLFSVSS